MENKERRPANWVNPYLKVIPSPRMSEPEWEPVNPCEHCNYPETDECNCDGYDLSTCRIYHTYIKEKAAQRNNWRHLMENERLLSDDEIESFFVGDNERPLQYDIEGLLEAQLTKADKWWKERLILAERKCRDLKCEYYRECGCIDSFGGNPCIWWQLLKESLEAKK